MVYLACALQWSAGGCPREERGDGFLSDMDVDDGIGADGDDNAKPAFMSKIGFAKLLAALHGKQASPTTIQDVMAFTGRLELVVEGEGPGKSHLPLPCFSHSRPGP